MEATRVGAKPVQPDRDLRRRPRDPVPERQSRRGAVSTAQDHEQAEADGQRGEDTHLQSAGGGVRLSGLDVRADLFGEDRQGQSGSPAVKESDPAHGGENPCADGPNKNLAGDRKGGGKVEPDAAGRANAVRSIASRANLPGGARRSKRRRLPSPLRRRWRYRPTIRRRFRCW